MGASDRCSLFNAGRNQISASRAAVGSVFVNNKIAQTSVKNCLPQEYLKWYLKNNKFPLVNSRLPIRLQSLFRFGISAINIRCPFYRNCFILRFLGKCSFIKLFPSYLSSGPYFKQILINHKVFLAKNAKSLKSHSFSYPHQSTAAGCIESSF